MGALMLCLPPLWFPALLLLLRAATSMLLFSTVLPQGRIWCLLWEREDQGWDIKYQLQVILVNVEFELLILSLSPVLIPAQNI